MSAVLIPGGTCSGMPDQGPIYGDTMSGVIPPAPELQDVPALMVNGLLSATAVPGDLLECTLGNWLRSPDAYDARWRRDGTANIGDGSPLYTATDEDAGTTVDCVVVARNAFGETAAPPSNAVTIAAGTQARGATAPHRR